MDAAGFFGGQGKRRSRVGQTGSTLVHLRGGITQSVTAPPPIGAAVTASVAAPTGGGPLASNPKLLVVLSRLSQSDSHSREYIGPCQMIIKLPTSLIAPRG